MQFNRHFKDSLNHCLSGAVLNASLTPALTCALTQALNSKCLLNCTPEGGRDLEGVAHVDVARRHEESEDGEQGEGQAEGCIGGKMVKLVHCTGLTLKDAK